MKKYLFIGVLCLGIISLISGYFVASKNSARDLLCSCVSSCDSSCLLNTKVGCNCGKSINNNEDSSCLITEEPSC